MISPDSSHKRLVQALMLSYLWTIEHAARTTKRVYKQAGLKEYENRGALICISAAAAGNTDKKLKIGERQMGSKKKE
jgi:hypothetical protein